MATHISRDGVMERSTCRHCGLPVFTISGARMGWLHFEERGGKIRSRGGRCRVTWAAPVGVEEAQS